jgi:hypothetical protein
VGAGGFRLVSMKNKPFSHYTIVKERAADSSMHSRMSP